MIKIGDVAKILGISSQTIRKYEDLKIIRVVKDELTGYRFFNIGSLNRALRVRFYRKALFDLTTATQLVESNDLHFVREKVEHQRLHILKKIEKDQRICARLEELQALISSIPQQMDRHRLAPCPGFYYLPYYCHERIVQEPKAAHIFAAMVDLMPLSTPAPMFQGRGEDFSQTELEYGMIIEDRYTHSKEIRQNALHIPPQSSAYTVIGLVNRSVLQIEDLAPLLQFARQQGLRPVRLVGRTILSMSHADNPTRYHEFWAVEG